MHSLNETLDTIRCDAEDIVSACEQLTGGTSAACTKLALRILKKLDTIQPSMATEEPYGQMERREKDADGVSGGGQKRGQVHDLPGAEEQLSKVFRDRIRAATRARPGRKKRRRR